MKKLYLLLLLPFFIFSCSDDSEEVNPNLSKLEVNLYTPRSISQEVVPQLTIKNDEVQATAFGRFNGKVPQGIEKLYISDRETQTEWVVLVDESVRPVFMYGINSATKQKLPYLYWIDHTSQSQYTLRFYEYDWVNRLGTLEYEVKVTNDKHEVIFDNATPSKGGRSAGKRTKSYPAPVISFETYGLKTSKSSSKLAADESIDEIFDRKVGELMDLLKETKTKLIEAPCDVSEAVDSPNKSFVCKLSEQVNKITDKEIFEDVEKATEQEQSGSKFGFDGLKIKLDLDFFDDYDITDNIERHVNDVHNSGNANSNLEDWVSDMQELSDTENEALNDLSDSKGVIQIGLSWNTTADIDLHVVDPFGEEIYYSNPSSSSGGYLDLDDTDGHGPENVYWTKNIPDGQYKIYLVYFAPENGPATDFTVKIINGLGVRESIPGSLGFFDHNKVHIVTFTKSGNTLKF